MKEKLIKLITDALNTLGISEDNISLEIPKNKDNGDYSTNVALKSAKKINKSPMELANSLKDLIHSEFIEEVNVAMPGFINFKLKKDYLYENLNNVLTLKGDYGRQSFGNNEKVNIEFVSANPTGILHMGNARGGAYGDSLARIMSFCGYDVTKEYYLNDAGNQINKLANSVYSRYLTLCGIENEFPENGYPGKEIYDIAKKLYSEYKDKYVNNDFNFIKEFSTKYLTDIIFEHLKEYRINYDVITSEKSIYQKYNFDDVINKMRDNGYIYEKDGAIWFKSSAIYDDQDHVLIKSDGTNTYLLPDILYHEDKIKRGFTQIIDVLGTDHHGYVARLKGAIKALGLNDNYIDIKLLQLVRIIQNHEVVTMHKRTGKVITLKDLIDDTSVNAVRFYFSKYSLDTQMDFDIDLARSSSNDNQVYYICYAYARICSILNKYNKEVSKLDDYNYITGDSVQKLLTFIYKFPDVVKSAALKKTPHILANYSYELSSLFHNFYETNKIITENDEQTKENICLIKAVKITLFNALNLIGVVPEERM